MRYFVDSKFPYEISEVKYNSFIGSRIYKNKNLALYSKFNKLRLYYLFLEVDKDKERKFTLKVKQLINEFPELFL